MRVKETVILALKLARREQRVLVVGRDENRWLIQPLEDPGSDQLRDGIIVTPQGLRYPEDEGRVAELASEGL